MARIRSVKPELRRDLTVASWPFEVRYFWVLLWGYCDDKGRGDDDPRLLKSDCFPLDDNITAKKVETYVDRMQKDGRICRYEVDGRKLLHVLNWHHQKINRPTRSVLPPCPHHERKEHEDYRGIHAEVVSIHGGLTESSLNDTGVIPEGSPPEQGSKGAREQGTRATNIGTRLLDEHVAAYRHAPPRDVQRKTGEVIDRLVTEGIDPRGIAAGLTRMRQKNAGYGLLPLLVTEAMNDGAAAPRSEVQQRYKGGLS